MEIPVEMIVGSVLMLLVIVQTIFVMKLERQVKNGATRIEKYISFILQEEDEKAIRDANKKLQEDAKKERILQEFLSSFLT